jgi:hypothetical protein
VVRITVGARNLFFLQNVQTGSKVHLPFYGVGTRGPVPAAERSGGERNHSSPPTADVEKKWSYTFTPPPYEFMALTGTNLPFLP